MMENILATGVTVNYLNSKHYKPEKDHYMTLNKDICSKAIQSFSEFSAVCPENDTQFVFLRLSQYF